MLIITHAIAFLLGMLVVKKKDKIKELIGKLFGKKVSP